ILRGSALSRLGMDRVTSDHMGMLATLLNALALQDTLGRTGMEAVVQSALPTGGMAEQFHRERAVQYLREGKVVVFAGGTGNPFFTTDTAAALRAAEIGAEAVFKGTYLADGVYDKDPVRHPDARRFDRLTYREALQRGLEVMDWTAISFCMEQGLPIVVFRIGTAGNFRRAVLGEAVGTLIYS
ncbi:MAG: UMP kinase, partial [Candidatus Latescibacterota bacterium]